MHSRLDKTREQPRPAKKNSQGAEVNERVGGGRGYAVCPLLPPILINGRSAVGERAYLRALFRS